MEEIDSIPFLWRLEENTVNLVVPDIVGDGGSDLTIETNIISSDSRHAGFYESNDEVQWDENDVQLFMRLVLNSFPTDPHPEEEDEETIKVDLTSPHTVEIIQIVAAAGFGKVHLANDIMTLDGRLYPYADIDIGDQASIATVTGFKRCVIVDKDDERSACVLLDDIQANTDKGFYDYKAHDLLLVDNQFILSEEFAFNSFMGIELTH